MSLKRLYGTIEKVTDQPDGTVIVQGIASSEAVDSEGEVVKASAMAAALPGYMKFANVREMHQAIAAGTALACYVDDGGVTHITAHIVDDGSVKKVKAGVLKGFSIGGKVKSRDKANPKVIDALELNEISVVDRPANPDALIELVKSEKPLAETAKPEPVAKAETPADPSEPVEPPEPQETPAQEAAEEEGEDGPLIPGSEGEPPKAAAAKPDDIEKASKLKQACIAMHKALASAGFCKDDGDVESAAPTGDLAKMAGERDALLEKVAAAEAATSAAGEALKKALAERDTMKADLDAARVDLARKGSLRVVPVEKGQEGAPVEKAAAPAEGTPERALFEMRKVHASGGRPLNSR